MTHVTQRTGIAVGFVFLALLAVGAGSGHALRPIICLVRPPVALAGECPGPLLFEIRADFAPSELPRRAGVPIAFHATAEVHYEDGGHPPALREVTLEFDKHAAIEADGRSACGRSEIVEVDFARAKRVCADSIVGRGLAHVEVVESEGSDAARTLALPFVVFNGGVRNGVTTLLIDSSPPAGSEGPSLVVAKARRIENGRFGTEVVVAFPRIAEGNGSIIDFGFGLRRRLPDGEGGIAVARCTDGRLNLKATSVLSDGSRLAGSLVRRCVPS